MIYREFKDLKLSGLGLGMMRLPVMDGDESKIDEVKTEEIIDIAYRNGINYYDTAWGYHHGNSELIAGRYLSKYPRESYYLASKFPGFDVANMSRVEEIFETQLKKCQTPYFDFYLFHNVNEGNIDGYLDPKFGIMDYLRKQKENGRIRHLGFSAHGSYDVIKRFLDAYGSELEFCQLQLNYLDWHYQKADEKVKLAAAYGLPVWVMEPLRGGKLASADEEKKTRLAAMRPEETVPAWGFRFLQTLPEVKMVLSGMSSLQQLQENLETWKEDKPLSEAEFTELVRIADEAVAKAGLPCTACRYCTSHCPQELPIPELIGFFNEFKVSGSPFVAKMMIGKMPEEKRPASCVGCRSCEQVCPQNIKISEMMRELSFTLSD